MFILYQIKNWFGVIKIAIVRSLTIHLPNDYVQRIDFYIDSLEKISSKLIEKGYQVWSKRISLPVSREDVFKVCDYIHANHNKLPSYFIAAFNMDPGYAKIPSATDLLSCMFSLRNVFSTLLIREDSSDITRFLREFYSHDQYEVYTRFAGIIGEWVMTPYFPSSPSLVNEATVSIALRYTDLFDKAYGSREGYVELVNWLRDLDKVAREASEESGIRYGGIDLSLSPWMSESVAALVEKYAEASIDSPGVASVIHGMNRFIEKIASDSGVKRIGFNEVMLPVEEDNTLKTRVSEKRVTLTTLLRLTPYCIVGVDMIVVPRKRFFVEKFLRDLLASYHVKKKPLGFRVIPVNREAGERIDLGRFGSATVAEI